jgi:hypothetical protein
MTSILTSSVMLMRCIYIMMDGENNSMTRMDARVCMQLCKGLSDLEITRTAYTSLMRQLEYCVYEYCAHQIKPGEGNE